MLVLSCQMLIDQQFLKDTLPVKHSAASAVSKSGENNSLVGTKLNFTKNGVEDSTIIVSNNHKDNSAVNKYNKG